MAWLESFFPSGRCFAWTAHMQKSLSLLCDVIAQGFELFLCYGFVLLRLADIFSGPNSLETQNKFPKCNWFCCDPWTSALQTSALAFLRKTISEVEYFLCVHAVHHSFRDTIESDWCVFDKTEIWCCFIGPCLCTHTTWSSFAFRTWKQVFAALGRQILNMTSNDFILETWLIHISANKMVGLSQFDRQNQWRGKYCCRDTWGSNTGNCGLAESTCETISYEWRRRSAFKG